MQYSKKITINKAAVTGSHVDFPVLVSLSPDAQLAAYAQNDGYDIPFTSSDGATKIPHEIEKFDGATGELVAWVKVDSVSSASNAEIYMYYGYGSANNQQDATKVWDSNYLGVWDLKETPGTDAYAYDSTTNDHELTFGSEVTSGDQVDGKIGGAIDFDDAGSNDILTMGDDPSFGNMSDLTVETW